MSCSSFWDSKPRNTWEDKDLYDVKAVELAENQSQLYKFEEFANAEIMAGAPSIS
jgi:phosphoenolpyruvate carboxykinase (ATP)